ncbi:hypothetical protein P4O66_001733 [Electrophorus voltai]|uniref:Uncharacterized protein n=1 Tax=Electrophorus voltai TaxID=2609070 RepID=A0AAD9DTV7_9TELE|nr:hypothetical protein P4O66_001733 [Electrophorus voltai]
MMTYGWYVAKLRRHLPGVNFPGRLWNLDPAEDSDGFTIERFLQHNTHRPVFACIGLSEGDPSWERTFSRWPWGVCEQLVPVTRRLHPEEWARSTQRLYDWRQPHDSFPLGSWERVANEEMWQARMKMPFFLFDLAERLEGIGQTRLYELSYDTVLTAQSLSPEELGGVLRPGPTPQLRADGRPVGGGVVEEPRRLEGGL